MFSAQYGQTQLTFSFRVFPFMVQPQKTHLGAQAEFTNKSADFFSFAFHVYGVASENTSGATHTGFI